MLNSIGDVGSTMLALVGCMGERCSSRVDFESQWEWNEGQSCGWKEMCCSLRELCCVERQGWEDFVIGGWCSRIYNTLKRVRWIHLLAQATLYKLNAIQQKTFTNRFTYVDIHRHCLLQNICKVLSLQSQSQSLTRLDMLSARLCYTRYI